MLNPPLPPSLNATATASKEKKKLYSLLATSIVSLIFILGISSSSSSSAYYSSLHHRQKHRLVLSERIRRMTNLSYLLHLPLPTSSPALMAISLFLGSVDPDIPSWVDPGSEHSDGNDSKKVLFEGIVPGLKNLGEFGSSSRSGRLVPQENYLGCGDDARDKVDFEESGESKGMEPKSFDSGEFWSDSGGDRSCPGKVENAEGDSGLVSGSDELEFKAEETNGSDSGVMMEVAADGVEVTEEQQSFE